MGVTTLVLFNIHQNSLLFVKILLSFLQINNKQLGFDLDLIEVDGKQFIKINKNGKKKQLIIIKVLKDHATYIAGLAITCQKAYCEKNDLKQSLVVKEFWQYVNQPEKNKLICKAIAASITNIS